MRQKTINMAGGGCIRLCMPRLSILCSLCLAATTRWLPVVAQNPNDPFSSPKDPIFDRCDDDWPCEEQHQQQQEDHQQQIELFPVLAHVVSGTEGAIADGMYGGG